MRTVKLLPLFLLCCISATARGDRRNPLAGQPAVRHRIELRKLRLEVSPQFVTSINQDYKHAFGAGANIQFHLTDWLGIAVEGAYTVNSNTALEDAVRAKLAPGSATDYKGPPQPTVGIHDEHVLGISYLASAYAAITPFSGKISLFSALFFNYDLYGMGGVGVVNYKNTCCSNVQAVTGNQIPDPNTSDGSVFAGAKIGGMFGVGAHVFFNDWIGMQFELRDYLVHANPGGLDVNGDRLLNSDDEGFQNNLFFGAGLTLMIPPRAKISR